MMWRDANEAPLLVVLLVLPLVIAAPRLRRSRSAALAICVVSAQLLLWFAYYVSGVGNLGLFWPLISFAVAIFLGLTLAVASWMPPRRRSVQTG